MHLNGLRRLKLAPVTLVAAGTLALAALGATTASGAQASVGGTSGYSATQGFDTYTCDTVTVTGPGSSVFPGDEAIEGTSNCDPSNGAPASGEDFNDVNIVQRSDGTTYSCFGWYGGITFANTPDSVQSIACYLSS